MKKIAISILTGILTATSAVCYGETLSDELAEGIVRLHIVAESDSKEDQAVKIKIRDRILEEMKNFESAEEIEDNIMFFENVANSVLREEGFDYTAKAQFGVFEFPTKYYDGFALPKGEYTAVRVVLGEGEGKNWWCVLFPPLCMVDAATGDMDVMLKDTFGDNYSVVATDKNMHFKIKFKLAELF